MIPFRGVNAATIELVKRFEGFSSVAYTDRAGVWTIGYGHTIGVKEGNVYTQEQGYAMLLFDLGVAAGFVGDVVKRPLNGNQFGALVSFTFNCGVNAFLNSRLLRLVNRRMDCAVRWELSRWVHCNVDGVQYVLPGLVRRRAEEGILYATAPIGEEA